jgi:hypothetical protein
MIEKFDAACKFVVDDPAFSESRWVLTSRWAWCVCYDLAGFYFILFYLILPVKHINVQLQAVCDLPCV